MEEIIRELQKIKELTLLQTKQVLTLDDVSMLSGISKSHLYKMTCTCQVPHYKPFGKQIYFQKSEIQEWLLQNRVTPVAEAEQMALAYMQKGGIK